MAKKKEEVKQPHTSKYEGSPYSTVCPHCNGSKTIMAPAYPGFEGKETLPIPCPYCK